MSKATAIGPAVTNGAATAIESSLLLREDHIATHSRWRQIDRVFWLSISLVYGPVMLVALIGIAVFNRLNASKWGQREARW